MAAGVIVTYLTIIACVLAVRRFGPGPLSLVLGIGLVTPLRWLGAIGLTCLLLGYWFLVTAIPRVSSSRRWWAAWLWVAPCGSCGWGRCSFREGRWFEATLPGSTGASSVPALVLSRLLQGGHRFVAHRPVSDALDQRVSARQRRMDPSRGRMRLRPWCPSHSEDASFRREGTTHRPG